MELIQDFREKFEALIALKMKYELPVIDTIEILESVDTYRVTTPVIGNFSTGKSSLINAIIGRPILGVEITPETAVPTEIYYGKENLVLEYTRDEVKEHKVEELPLQNLSIQKTDLVTLQYNNDFLKQIKTVSLVDLPGFDTNIELHNRAIDQYLPNSLAYLLVIAADEPVLKESIANFLKELKEHHMPVYIVLTKCNRLLEEELEECKALLLKLVKGLLERDDVKIACVDSYGRVRIDEVKEILLEIESKTGEIFNKKYSAILQKELEMMEFYFAERIDKRDLSTSELEYQQEQLEKKIERLFVKLEKEKADFDHQMNDCIGFVQKRIRSDLRATTDEISVLLENGADITEKLNMVVRGAIMLSIKTEIEPNLQKYLSSVTDVIHVEFADKLEVMEEMKRLGTRTRNMEIGTKASPAILAAVGIALANPIVVIIGALAGGAADAIFNSKWDRKKEREAKKAAEKIVEEIESLAADLASEEIRAYIKKVNENIEAEVLKQKATIEKSIEHIKEQVQIEEGFKENEIEKLREDLTSVRNLYKGV